MNAVPARPGRGDLLCRNDARPRGRKVCHVPSIWVHDPQDLRRGDSHVRIRLVEAGLDGASDGVAQATVPPRHAARGTAGASARAVGWQLGPPSNSSLSNLTVSNTIDLSHGLYAESGSDYVRFQSSSSDGSKDCLFQDFDTVAGQKYTVTFSVALTNPGVSDPSKIGLDPVWDENGANQTTMGASNFYFAPSSSQGPIDYQTFSFVETASGTTTRIDFHGVDNAGSILLDNVSVVPTSPAGQPPTVTAETTSESMLRSLPSL